MTGKSGSLWTALVLLVLGIGSLLVRHNLVFESGDDEFILTYTTDFHARNRNAELKAAFPEATRFCHVLEPRIDPPDLEVVHTRAHSAAKRKDIVLRTNKSGQIHCTVSFRIDFNKKGWRQAGPDTPLTADERARYLANAKGMTVNSPTAQEMLNRLRDGHPGTQELLDRIFQECFRNIERTGAVGNDSGDETLLHQKGSPIGRAEAFAILCRAAKFPTRLVTGFEIKKGSDVQPRTWVEVFAVDRWEPYDPENGFMRELDYNFVPVRRDGGEPVRVTSGSDVKTTFSIEGAPPATHSALSILDLRRLPAKLQEPIKVVLILPIGALLTALVRTIIGIRTFGTFSPTLLALAFVYNDWQGGLCIFFIVLATGFVSRTLLDRLKLLLVPRLGIILTMVVMLMVLGVSAMNYFHHGGPSDQTGQIVLLPMVILTNLVERFYVTTEEDSFFEAARLLFTTMCMALVIYLLLRSPQLGELLFENPELHFFTVVILIMMGRYTGYRLTELVRFRDLVHSDGNPPQDSPPPEPPHSDTPAT